MNSSAQTIVRFNIEHFRRLLLTETDPSKRKKIFKLLVEEETKLTTGVSATKKKYGMKCPECGDRIIAPVAAAYVSEHQMRNDWRCAKCGHEFQKSMSFGEPHPPVRRLIEPFFPNLLVGRLMFTN